MTGKTYSSCSYCGGNVEEELVRSEVWFGDKLIVFEDVPAGVCDGCGEEYFSPEIQEKMFTMMQGEPQRSVTVPVFRYTDALTAAKSHARRKKKEEMLDDPEEQIQFASDDEIEGLMQTDLEDWEEQ